MTLTNAEIDNAELDDPDLTDWSVYEYRLLQFCYDLTCEERVNVGVVSRNCDTGQILVRIAMRPTRVAHMWPDLDMDNYLNLARTISRVFAKMSDDHSDVGDTLAEITDSVIRPGSGSFAWSGVRYGITEDLPGRVDQLFAKYVLREVPTQADRDMEVEP